MYGKPSRIPGKSSRDILRKSTFSLPGIVRGRAPTIEGLGLIVASYAAFRVSSITARLQFKRAKCIVHFGELAP